MMIKNIKQSSSQQPLKVLITGAAGFIGRYLGEYLQAQGCIVRALTRDLQHAYVKKQPGFTWKLGDVTKADSLIGLCENIDYVFHLAGFAHAWEEEQANFAAIHEAVNFQGTLNLLAEAQRAKVKRFVFFSTIKACADDPTRCLDENWIEWPCSSYGMAKRRAEEAILMACQTGPTAAIVLRPTLVYGANWKGNLATMLKAVDKGYFPSPPPSCRNKKSMVSVNDLITAAFLATQAPLTEQRIFIVSDGKTYSTYDIYQMMRAALGKKKNHLFLPLVFWRLLAKVGDIAQKILKKRMPINSEAVKKLFDNMWYGSAYIEKTLGFEPKQSFESILPDIIASYRGEK